MENVRKFKRNLDLRETGYVNTLYVFSRISVLPLFFMMSEFRFIFQLISSFPILHRQVYFLLVCLSLFYFMIMRNCTRTPKPSFTDSAQTISSPRTDRQPLITVTTQPIRDTQHDAHSFSNTHLPILFPRLQRRRAFIF